jgi:hypothetical protein
MISTGAMGLPILKANADQVTGQMIARVTRCRLILYNMQNSSMIAG